jgi:hypothetical protein
VKISVLLDRPVTLTKVTCDSDAFEPGLKEVEKGKEYEVTMTTKPPLEGMMQRGKVTVETDLKECPTIELHPYVTIQPRVTVAPRVLAAPIPVYEDHEAIIIVRNLGQKPVHVTGVETCSDEIKTKTVEMDAGRGYRIDVTVPGGFEWPTGEGPCKVVIQTDDEEFARFELPFLLRKVPPPTTQAAGGSGHDRAAASGPANASGAGPGATRAPHDTASE